MIPKCPLTYSPDLNLIEENMDWDNGGKKFMDIYIVLKSYC